MTNLSQGLPSRIVALGWRPSVGEFIFVIGAACGVQTVIGTGWTAPEIKTLSRVTLKPAQRLRD
ncbi:MAG: hypothetical protein ABI379_10710 [Rhodanobacter sp.]